MEPNTQQKLQNWSESLTLKMLIIGLMTLLLLIPLSMIKDVIEEREETAQQVENEISNQWGNPQIITGPILSIPVVVLSELTNGEQQLTRKWLHVMPGQLTINGNINPEVRYRGIYKNVVYDSHLEIEGSFAGIEQNDETIQQIEWQGAQLTMGISDNRGIRGDVKIEWMGNTLVPESGTITKDIFSSGFSSKTPLTAESAKEEKPFKLTIELNGSKSISFVPIGQNSSITLSSAWKDPGFTGAYLPQNRKIDENGFLAEWHITHLNRNFPQQWIGKQFSTDDYQLGVNLFLPVNHYQKSLRSAKYGILFISLTVLVFLFIELTKKKRIHLFHYLLVGLALVLFFSVLTALSEQVGFNFAYLLASAVIIAMVTFFTYAILANRKQTLWVASILVVLYAFLFVLLQLNEYAFLAGNIGLLIALASIMKASLKLPGHSNVPDSQKID
jgi:inner membrane protein